MEQKDEDVEREAEEAIEKDPSEVAVLVKDLRKIYGNCLTKKCLAVQSVSFIVERG